MNEVIRESLIIGNKPFYCIRVEEFDALRAENQRLRGAIQKHKDKYIFTNPDYEDYQLWAALEVGK